MKEYDDFKEDLKQEFAMLIDSTEEISIHQVKTFNKGKREIVVISTRHDRQILSHNCFLDSLFEQYQEGRPLVEIVEAVLDECRNKEKDWPVGKTDSFYPRRIGRSVEDVKGRLFFRMINTERNAEILKDMPHFDYLDLSMIFYISIGKNEKNILSVPVTNETLCRLGITKEHLQEIALENTERLLPLKSTWLDAAILEDLEEKPVLTEEMQELKRELIEHPGIPIILISNEIEWYGFGAVFYLDFLKKAAEVFQDDLYILPCSVHEAILCPTELICGAGELSALVKHVNETELAPDEYLSDHVYYYDRNTDKIQMITEQGE